MNNKEQIIIDGIKVSECCFFNNGKCSNPNICTCNCSNVYYCYFKEYQRKTQECNRYHKALEEIEKLVIKTNRGLCNNCGWVNTISCIPSEYICGDIKQILDIINKAKGEEDE